MKTSIINVLIEAVRDRLIAELMTNISDESKAGHIQAGAWHDDPTTTRINLLVHPGDKDWPHTLNITGEGVNAPIYEIGGTPYGVAHWRRRFRVELRLFFDNEQSRDTARQTANVVLSNAEEALRTMDVPVTRDDFGEYAYFIQIVNSYMNESGDVGEFIWRGEIKLEFLTERV